MALKNRCQPFAHMVQDARKQGIYPYFRPIDRSWGTEVEVSGRRLIMIGSNDYLGFTHDPRIIEATAKAALRWGSGPGGSRFLCGNLTLHEALEERLAAFVGKKKAVVHATGFTTNLGAIACMLTPQDIIVCDRENHASIFEGCQASRARLIKLAAARQRNANGCLLLITEGVFSMSGDMAPLDELVKLKKAYHDLLIYLDDAHGLGVMGKGGRGTAHHFGHTSQVDFIMGTFSKALASIGGFIASDDEDVLEYLRHHSKPLIFSAALPASNAATVLACLDLLDEDPGRVTRLWEITRQVHQGYQEIGVTTRHSKTPIIPICIGSEDKAFIFAKDMFDHGVFALPAIYPAVPRGQAVIRTAYMSTHKKSQIDYVLEVIAKLAKKHRIRACDLEQSQPFVKERVFSGPGDEGEDSAVSQAWD
jgi:glycine C-acetyltransferase